MQHLSLMFNRLPHSNSRLLKMLFLHRILHLGNSSHHRLRHQSHKLQMLLGMIMQNKIMKNKERKAKNLRLSLRTPQNPQNSQNKRPQNHRMVPKMPQMLLKMP